MEGQTSPSIFSEASRAQLAYAKIKAGETNLAVYKALIDQFDIPPEHITYPGIYRAHLVMRGELTAAQARATRGPSLPAKGSAEAESLSATLRAPDVDLGAIAATLPESRVAQRRPKPGLHLVHRLWEESSACGLDTIGAINLGDVTCPMCLRSFEGWVGADGICPCCGRREWQGHAENCGLVSGESPLAALAPFARDAQGLGGSRPALLRAYAQAQLEGQVRRAEQAMAQARAEAAKLAALRQEVQ